MKQKKQRLKMIREMKLMMETMNLSELDKMYDLALKLTLMPFKPDSPNLRTKLMEEKLP